MRATTFNGAAGAADATVVGRGTKIDRADGTRNQLPSSEEPMWRDIAGNTILQKYGDLQVSHTVGGTGTVADKALNALGSLSGIGAGFDLPMALGILGAMGTVAPSDEHLFVGELSLDGAIRPVRPAVDQ